MLRMESVGMCVGRIILRIAGLVLMIMIGAVQAVGTIFTAMCAVILKKTGHTGIRMPDRAEERN